jgi:hypothetical protein
MLRYLRTHQRDVLYELKPLDEALRRIIENGNVLFKDGDNEAELFEVIVILHIFLFHLLIIC